MEKTIPVTQLRTHISALLKRLREHPDTVYRITHHSEVVAELRAPERGEVAQVEQSTEQEIAAFIDTFLARGVSKTKGAYPRIRKLCATPSEQLPYRSVEEAMTAIRGRGHGPD